MNSAEQAAGEKRVQDCLIVPLEGLGLIRPSGMTVAKFEDMLSEVRKKLAYMTALNIRALAEEVMTRIENKGTGRFPIAVDLLVWGARIQQPSDDGSPLIRAVFASDIGQRAMEGDWAPELLRHIRRVRVWPSAISQREIQEKAVEARRRIEKQNDALRYDEDLSQTEQTFRANRAAAADRCKRIYELARAEKTA